MVHLKLKRVHFGVEVNPVQETHDEDLGISLSSVPRFRTFTGFADLGDDDVGDNVAFVFVQTWDRRA